MWSTLLCKILVLCCFSQQFKQVETSLSAYVNALRSYFAPQEPDSELCEDLPPGIPYEVSVADEKFIAEALKLTGIATSDLDTCQQRVIFKLKADCNKMNDEQLAKMAVHLLNCQSYVEGRAMYPCTDDMSIRQCTEAMDSDTWTSYHLMSNRARAVCYSIRQVQFRGLAEHTVNNLMNAARDQLKTLSKISDNQQELQVLAEETLTSFSSGHDVLVNQQKDIQRAQLHGQLMLEENIRRLAQEKDFISDNHRELVELTQKLYKKLEDSGAKLEEQAGETHSNHAQLLSDLIVIQNKTHLIFQRIEESSKLLLERNDNFKQQYQETLQNLSEMNKTVHNLVHIMNGTRHLLEERLTWITSALGGTDLAVERLYSIIWHLGFMMVSMLTCAFLSASLTTRLIVTALPSLNLVLSFFRSGYQLGPLHLGASVLTLIFVHFLTMSAFSYKKRSGGAIGWPKKQELSVNLNVTSTVNEEEEEAKDELDDNFNSHDYSSLAAPISRSHFYKPRSRSNTPVRLNGVGKVVCLATTRAGTPCKLSCAPGRDYCYRHQTGSSVMGSP